MDAPERTCSARAPLARAGQFRYHWVRKRLGETERSRRFHPASFPSDLVGAGVNTVEIVLDGERVGDRGDPANPFGCPELAGRFEDPAAGRVDHDEGAIVAKRLVSMAHSAALRKSLGQVDQEVERLVGGFADAERDTKEIHAASPRLRHRKAGEHRLVADRETVFVHAHLGAPHPSRAAYQNSFARRLDRPTPRRSLGRIALIAFDELHFARFAIAVLRKPHGPIVGHHRQRVAHASPYHQSSSLKLP